MGYIEFNGRDSGDLGVTVYTDTAKSFAAAKRQYIEHKVPGRNGTLKESLGTFDNVQLKFNIAIPQGENIMQRVELLREWLLAPEGYRTLKINGSTDYRLATYATDFSVEAGFLLRSGTATLTFDCKPQVYYTSGNTWTTVLTSKTTLTKPFSAMPSYPVIEFSFSEGALFTDTMRIYNSNDMELAFVQLSTSGIHTHTKVTIDTETRDCRFEDGTSAASFVVFAGDFAVKENVKVAKGNNNATVRIQPRWWHL